MVELHELPRTTIGGKKRRGRGRGSGKGGHTVGRGQKGQKTRGRIALTFEGTKIKKSLLKRLPLLRGKGKLKSRKKNPVIVNLKYLNLLPKGSIADIENLVKYGIVGEEAKIWGVKILGEGSLNCDLQVKLPVSKGAKAKIEKAGGKILTAQEALKPKREKKEKVASKPEAQKHE